LVRRSGTFAQIALLNVAYTIRTLVLVMPNMMSRVFAPLLCSLRATDEPATYRRTFWTCLWFNGGTTVAAAMVLLAVGPQLLSIFGKDFTGGRLILGLLLASAVAEAVAAVLFQPLYGHGKIWTQLAVSTLWAMLLVGGTWGGIDRAGAAAVAAAYLAAWLSTVMMYCLINRRLFDEETKHSLSGATPVPCSLSSEAA
jgi:O-antigen/teichoic acid export membrane protein